LKKIINIGSCTSKLQQDKVVTFLRHSVVLFNERLPAGEKQPADNTQLPVSEWNTHDLTGMCPKK